jgi:hypothetical protein
MSLVLVSSAWAQPPAAQTQSLKLLGAPETTLVQERRDRGARRFEPSRRYEPGRRYDRAPPNWRRHSRRPGDWRTRGCILVGPLWFCP